MIDQSRVEVTPKSRYLDDWDRIAATLPTRTPTEALGVRPGDDVLVLAAHPDDETLGAGATVAALVAAGVDVHVVALTAGEAALAHVGYESPDLAARRRSEFASACRRLGVSTCQVLDLGDSLLSEREEAVTEVVQAAVRRHRPAHVLTPWWQDPHPDHAAVGRACQDVADHTDFDVSGYLLWALHWSHPDDILTGENRMVVLSHDEDALAARRAAVLRPGRRRSAVLR